MDEHDDAPDSKPFGGHLPSKDQVVVMLGALDAAGLLDPHISHAYKMVEETKARAKGASVGGPAQDASDARAHAEELRVRALRTPTKNMKALASAADDTAKKLEEIAHIAAGAPRVTPKRV